MNPIALALVAQDVAPAPPAGSPAWVQAVYLLAPLAVAVIGKLLHSRHRARRKNKPPSP